MELGTVFDENRAQLTPDQIPRVMRDAIVAVEDARFYQHGAIDGRSVVRAFVANVREGRTAQGGSTITQQLAKLMFSDPNAPRTFKQKIMEARLAISLEERYKKDDILAMYLNRAYFGARAYGVVAAAETYFGTSLDKITLGEAALLAGMVQAPTSLDPFKNPKGALQRRAYVLRRMRDEHMVTTSQETAAAKQPLHLVRHAVSAADRFKFPYVVYYVEQEFLSDPAFGRTEAERADRLFKGGLTITISVDSHWQTYAEEAVQKILYLKTDPDAALASLDPRTGRIKAMVGGRSFADDNFNIAANGERQPGSSFKPFDLGAALEEGIPPTARYASWPTTLRYHGIVFPVRNYDGAGHGIVTLRHGMEESINGVYARLALKVGLDKVIDFAQRAGITSQLDAFPAISLGALTYGTSPLQMASAYGTFATNGVHYKPHIIERVQDSNDTLVYNDGKITGQKVMDPEVAYTITDVLRGVACKGTATRAMFGRPMAAKTGTTDGRKDVWLVGYTPDLATAVWVGYRRPKAMSVLHGLPVFGGTFGAAIWKAFMSRALAGSPIVPFTPPGEQAPLSQAACDYGHGPGLIGEAVKVPDGLYDGTHHGSSSPTPSQSPTSTPSPTATATPSPKHTKPPKPTPTPTPTPTATPT
ncbi:MAG: transglycosylase domain-containing protein [Actinomycetota bacterium]